MRTRTAILSVGTALLGASVAIGAAGLAGGCGSEDAAVTTPTIDAAAIDVDAAARTTTAPTDDAAASVVDAAVPVPEASCDPERVLLDAALGMGVCSQCIGSKCPFFVNECVPDCRCVASTVTLLTCLEVAATHTECLTNATSLFTPTQLMELGECEATCAAVCHPGNDTTPTPDAAAPDAKAPDSGQTGTADAAADGAITDASDSG